MSPVWKKATPGKSPTADQQHAGARVVQHHFVRSQLRHINTYGRDDLVRQTLEAIRAHAPGGSRAKQEHLEDGFEHMTRRLQTADLTINLEAPSWFLQPNPYDTYTQMYERATQRKTGPGGREMLQPMVLKDVGKNPADVRVNADERATFPQHMLTSGGAFKREFGGIGRMMSPGGLKQVGTTDKGQGLYNAVNPHFNPHSKQVFAALNYGRRPHGACIDYGHSYLVLSEKFKTDAIYFAGDTFFASDKAQQMAAGAPAGFLSQVSAAHQVSYQLLGAVYAFASNDLKEALGQSCLWDMTLNDTSDAGLLLEAHLFQGLAFRGGAVSLHISRKDNPRDQNGNPGSNPLTASEWQAIVINARSFASKHKLRLKVMD